MTRNKAFEEWDCNIAYNYGVNQYSPINMKVFYTICSTVLRWQITTMGGGGDGGG